MNEQLAAIHTELLQMKEELEARLLNTPFSAGFSGHQFVSAGNTYVSCKEELQDVLLALSKSKRNIRHLRRNKSGYSAGKDGYSADGAHCERFLYHAQFEKRRFLFGLRRMKRSTGRSTHNILQEGRAFALLQDVNEYSFTPFFSC
ncbi:hypothetical protein PO124_01370 [Bacillus licheniformis]|nr:hypothetical protein [Bacillus licheniformis]